MRRKDWLPAQLPAGMAEDDFLRRFLMIFQDVSDTVLHQIDTLDGAFDPTVASPEMLRTLGAWIGIDWIDPTLDESMQRRAVQTYSSMLRWRGTTRGMVALLQLLSDDPDVTVEDSGGFFPEGDAPREAPHVRLAMGSSSWATADDVVGIVRAELPAGVTFDLTIDGVQVWPPGGESPRERVGAGEVG